MVREKKIVKNQKMGWYVERYDIYKSLDVFKLYKAIYFSKGGLFYSELWELSKKSKGTLSDQLKPLKDNNFIIKEYYKYKKDYLFTINYNKLAILEMKHQNEIRSKVKKQHSSKFGKMASDDSIIEFSEGLHESQPELNNSLYIALNFEQYFFLKARGTVPIKNKSDLKIIFK
jgi:DNA-binding transcriptional regulator GbsR (MarR family)